MSKFRGFLSILGFSLVAAAVAIALQPGLLSQVNVPQIGQLPALGITALIMLIFGLYGLKSFRVSNVSKSDLTLQLEQEPEMVKDRFDDLAIQFEWKNEEEARKVMKDTVKQVLRQQKNNSSEEAEEIVAEGEWTDNRVAAAFIDTGIKYPLLERLREWLEEEGTLERRINTTVKAVEELHEEDD